MSYAIGAAGTGGHIYPGLAVAEELVGSGVSRSDITFIGGTRLEQDVYPREGFPFVEVNIRGLQRRFTLDNLALPWMVRRAARTIETDLRARDVRVALAMGSYVSVPIGWAARRAGVPFFLHEQNAKPGVANRFMARWAEGVFVSFGGTPLAGAIEVGNPVRHALARFSRVELRVAALERYGLDDGPCTIGIVGGSLGARILNEAAVELIRSWDGRGIQLLHVCGPDHLESVQAHAKDSPITWRVVGFEEEMQYLYAACDVVVARGGGMVGELLATETPSVLVPGGFGSTGHQDANADAARQAGAAVVLSEGELDQLGDLLRELCDDPERLEGMARAAAAASKPQAAARIAAILMGRHG